MLCRLFGLWCSVLGGIATPVDGDTLDLQGHRLRVWGIDAPEWWEPQGSHATAVMRLYLRDPVRCTDTGARTYGRWVVRCTLPDSRDLGQVLVESGAALDCPQFSFGQYRKFEPATARSRITQKPYC